MKRTISILFCILTILLMVACGKTEVSTSPEDYIDKPAEDFISVFGEPSERDYGPSCLGDGEDGVLIYDGFTIYTYREGDEENIVNVHIGATPEPTQQSLKKLMLHIYMLMRKDIIIRTDSLHGARLLKSFMSLPASRELQANAMKTFRVRTNSIMQPAIVMLIICLTLTDSIQTVLLPTQNSLKWLPYIPAILMRKMVLSQLHAKMTLLIFTKQQHA